MGNFALCLPPRLPGTYAHSFAFPRPFFFAGAASGSPAAGAAAGGDGSLLGRRRFTFFLPPVAPVAGVVLLEAAPELEAAPPRPTIDMDEAFF